MKFTPTEAQILAAQQLFIAMAFHEVAKAEFEKMENEILQSGNYHYDEKYYSTDIKRTRHHYPENKILQDRKELFCISGLSLLERNGYENTDCHKFYNELAKKATEAGFIHAENAEAKADSDVRRLEAELIKATYDIHQISLDKLVRMDDRNKLLDLLLNLFAPLVKNESYEENQKLFYNERMIEKVKLKNTYSNNEESFRKFQGLKQFIPLEEFVENTNEVEPYEGIEGVLMYEPPFYLFQIKEGAAWQYQGRTITASRYIIALPEGKAIHNNDLETTERELFNYFLKSHNL